MTLYNDNDKGFTRMSAVAISTMYTDTVAMTSPRPRPFRNLEKPEILCVILSIPETCFFVMFDKEVDHGEQPANVDEDAGVGEDDCEEAKCIAAR